MKNRTHIIGSKILLVLAGLMLFAMAGNAQDVTNANVERIDDDLIVTFDLIPRLSINELYDITVTAHYNNTSRDLVVKQGSLKQVRPGSRLTFVFSGKENLKNVRGEVDFSITAKLAYSMIRFRRFDNVKRGKTLDVSWRGGLEGDEYSLLLYRADSTVMTIQNQLSVNEFQWQVPESTKAGSKYRFKLVSSISSEQTVYSKEFKIKRKFPLVLKIVPAAIIAGAIYLRVKNSSSGDSDGDGFPNPPDLPDM